MGRASVSCIKERLVGQKIPLLLQVVRRLLLLPVMMTPDLKHPDVLFVPARGGLGEKLQNQANTICAKMAEKSMSHYRLLHVPDQLSDEAYRSIIGEPSIKDMLHLIKSAGMVVHGIGDAMTMAERRKTPQADLEKVKNGHAVGEAFGYDLIIKGEVVVYKVKTVGIQLDDLKNNKCVIAVAGGASKAKAIKAYFNKHRRRF